MPEAAEQLLDLLASLDEASQFCTSGMLAPVLPGLEVEGVGDVGLPIGPIQAQQLIAQAAQAPYGRGEETLVDTDVRRVGKSSRNNSPYTIRSGTHAGEIYEESMSLSYWIDAHGEAKDFGEITLEAEEVLNGDDTGDLPVEQEVHEATGNEGVTMERWYRSQAPTNRKASLRAVVSIFADFRVRKDRRQHLHQQIDAHGCDLTHVTERKGSPQTLVHTKTRASYERRQRQFEADTALLAELRG
jgi:hypothetical protein